MKKKMRIWHDSFLLVCWWYYCFVVLVQISGLFHYCRFGVYGHRFFGAVISIAGVHLAGWVKSAFPCISFFSKQSRSSLFSCILALVHDLPWLDAMAVAYERRRRLDDGTMDIHTRRAWDLHNWHPILTHSYSAVSTLISFLIFSLYPSRQNGRR